MNNEAEPYLAIVKDALGANLQPGTTPEMQQMTAMCGHRILASLLAHARRLPALREQSVHGYRDLLGDLKLLFNHGDDRALVADLEQQLGAHEPGKVEAVAQKISARLSLWPAQAPDAAQADRVLRQMVSLENRLRAGVVKACAEELAHGAADTAARAVLSAEQTTRLTQWLRLQFPGNESLSITGARIIPGGFSKQTLFVSLRDTRDLPDTMVIRLDWSDSPVGTTVVDEFNIIRTLFDAGVAVPFPYALETSGDVLGGTFLLLRKVDGTNIGDALDIHSGSKAFARDLARTLAKLHALPPAAFGTQVDGATESTTQRLFREIAAFESGWRALNETSIALEIAFAWLRKNIGLADGARALIHKDVGCHNMLALDDKVAALLDWETAAIGNPAQDLGYAYPTVVQMCDWREFIAAYAEAGGKPPAQAQIDYYTLWGFTWLTVMLMQARAAFTSGRVNDVRLGYVGAYLLGRLQARLAEKLDALAGTGSGCDD